MFRYIGFIWNSQDAQMQSGAERLTARLQSRSAASWDEVLSVPGMTVLCTGIRTNRAIDAYEAADRHCVVLGSLFERAALGEAVPRRARFSANQSARLVSSMGRMLSSDFWGRYVAFVYNKRLQAKCVLRDPTGGLPCFTATVDGVDLYFSDMEDFLTLAHARCTVNWDYLCAYLFSEGWLFSRDTALSEVRSLQAGECCEHRHDRKSIATFWNPVSITQQHTEEDVEKAAAQLRVCVRSCVTSWASLYDGILHRLSGGLDSSIVMACLRDAPAHVRTTCINHYFTGSNMDERSYARAMADHVGATLVERERDVNVRLNAILRLRPSPTPARCVYPLHYGRLESDLAREVGASAIFSGEMGDQLFYQYPALPAAGDYVHKHGLRPSLLSVALDVARLEGSSVWRVLRHALKQGFVRNPTWDPRTEILQYRELLNEDVMSSLMEDNRFIHPCLASGAARLPIGKLRHIYMAALTHTVDIYDPLESHDQIEHVAPLLSQPLIEQCLQIPTYTLLKGGWDRAAARRAFLHDLPRQIAFRRTKGGVETYIWQVFLKNIEFARELLLDGALVKRGILNKSRLAKALSSEPTNIRSPHSELHAYMVAEAWLTQWNETRQKAAA